jgi:hypothetical protein
VIRRSGLGLSNTFHAARKVRTDNSLGDRLAMRPTDEKGNCHLCLPILWGGPSALPLGAWLGYGSVRVRVRFRLAR